MQAPVYQDLRGFLTKLEEEGQLLHIKKEVMPEPDISAATRAVSGKKGAPALMFDHVYGYNTMVVTNVHGSWENHALMLGMRKDASIKEQFYELNRRWDLYPVKPRILQRSEAPCKENVMSGHIDLFELMALYRINEQDGGFYLSKPAVITCDPDRKGTIEAVNLGTYRIQVKGKDRVSIQAGVIHDIAVHQKKAEAAGEKLPIAIALGNAPLVTFMASTPVAYGHSEYEYVGALQNGIPAEIVPADRYPELLVPAGAEIVLEGYIEPGVREVEGPFGEFPGSYSESRKQLMIQIERVTYRSNPIFENLYLGIPWTEIDYLMALNTSVPLFKQIKAEMSGIVAVNAMYTHGMAVVVSVKPRFGGYAKGVAFKLLSTPHGMAYAKIIIVVDDYVDPFNLEQVMWALTTKVKPDKDVSIIENCAGIPLDPSSFPPGIQSKLIIDATTPVDPEPNPRTIQLLEAPKGTEEWEMFLSSIMCREEEV